MVGGQCRGDERTVDYLRHPSSRHPRLDAVVLALGSRLLVQADRCTTQDEAKSCLAMFETAGGPLKSWAGQIAAMGGDPKVTESPDKDLGSRTDCQTVRAPRSGTLTGYDVRQVGMTVVELGGGRTAPDAVIDPGSGSQCAATMGVNVSGRGGHGFDSCFLRARLVGGQKRASCEVWDGDQTQGHPPVDCGSPFVRIDAKGVDGCLSRSKFAAW